MHLRVGSVSILVSSLLFAAQSVQAVCPACPAEDPSFAYNDVDNDGCYTAGVDSDSIEDSLLGGFYEAPAGTGIVVPAKSKIIPDRGVAFSWTAAGMRVAGKVRTKSGGIQLDAQSLDVCQRARIVAVGLVDIATVGRVDLEAKAKIRAKLSTLDIESSAGAVDVASNALLLAAGSLSVVADNGITAGSNVKFKANGVEVDAILDAGNGPITAGDKLMISGGRIEMSAGGDIVVGERAKIRTRKILATDISLTSGGGSILFGPNLKLLADRDLTIAADGTVAFAAKSRCEADEGTLSVTTTIGFLDVIEKVTIEAPRCLLTIDGEVTIAEKSKITCPELDITSLDRIDISRTKIRSEDVVLAATGADLSFTGSSIRGQDTIGAALAGEICDLTASKFKKTPLDTSGCTVVIGP